MTTPLMLAALRLPQLAPPIGKKNVKGLLHMTLAARFSERVHDAMRQAQSLGYRPTRIQQMLAESRAVDVAKSLVKATEIHDGMVEMHKLGRLDLTIEQIMLEPEFAGLFKPIDLEYAKMRLKMVQDFKR